MYFVYISDPLYPAHPATPERQNQHEKKLEGTETDLLQHLEHLARQDAY